MEEQRIAVLQGLHLLDTPENENFDRFTRLVSSLLDAPIAAISLTDRSRQWFKSYLGINDREIPREGAPCAEVTATRNLLQIPDLLQHDGYKDSLLAKAGVRFYAGAPLTTRQGYSLGAFCILDNRPRELSTTQLQQLEDLAAMVMSQIELQHEFGRVDPGSKLPNRYQFEDDFLEMRRESPAAARVLILAEIVDPRHTNEAVSVLGSAYLDQLLNVCAERIREHLPKQVTLYHVGFATFGIVHNEDQIPWQELIERMIVAMQAPLEEVGSIVSATAVFGVVPLTASGSDAAEILRMATSAVHEARQGNLSFAVYDSVTHAAHKRRFDILRCLRDSLDRKEDFHLVYQPRVDAVTGVCRGAEALLRWSHPELGAVSPGEFIPLIEQTSLAGAMTRLVLTHAFAQVRIWKSDGRKLQVSINVSARDLEDPGFVHHLATSLAQHDVSAQDIELEFTEGVLIRYEGRVLQQLAALRELGVELAIDDFGTGYSSFSYIRRLPAQVLKLDQSFIRIFDEDDRVPLLVATMIQMGHNLGYRIVAEGVETEETLRRLRALGCDEAQGYFIAKPLSVSAFNDFLSTGAVVSPKPAFVAH